MESYDLCLAWNIPEDADFVQILEKVFKERSLGLLQVTPESYEEICGKVSGGVIFFKSFLDRASDNDPRFMFFIDWCREKNIKELNFYDYRVNAINKAFMHNLMLGKSMSVPRTIFLPPYIEEPETKLEDLSGFSEKFVIKPSGGGGGTGVILDATTWEQVLSARKENPGDTYLLQEFINARSLDGRQAWFRNFYCSGDVFSYWWDTATHAYEEVGEEEVRKYGLAPLSTMTSEIAALCKLDLFSNEIALDEYNRFLVIDSVNDQIDVRLQSKAADGIPEKLAWDLAESLARFVGSVK